MLSKGDRVSYAVKYRAGGSGPEAFTVLTRTEYGIVVRSWTTYVRSLLTPQKRVRIRVVDPGEGRSKYVERYERDVKAAPVPELDRAGRPKLTYAYLASLAVTPDPDHRDTSADNVHGYDGAYRGSPLGCNIGLHIHAPSDNWNETEPARPVHFCLDGSKIAEVYPFGVVNHSRGSTDPQPWRDELIRWGEAAVLTWMDRLTEANGGEISRRDARIKEGINQ
jgi:hypothetical protein